MISISEVLDTILSNINIFRDQYVDNENKLFGGLPSFLNLKEITTV